MVRSGRTTDEASTIILIFFKVYRSVPDRTKAHMRVEILEVLSCDCAYWLTTEKLIISRNKQSLQIIVKGLVNCLRTS